MNVRTVRCRTAANSLAVAVACLLATGCASPPERSTAPADAPPAAVPSGPAGVDLASGQAVKLVFGDAEGEPNAAAGAARSPGDVVARVNGTPILRGDVDAGLPKDAIDAELDHLRRQKLGRLVSTEALAQFLRGKGVAVAEDEVDARVAELGRDLPMDESTGVRYENLERLMADNVFSMPELRRMLWNELAFDRHCDARWSAEHPTAEALAAAVAAARPGLAEDFVKSSHVFFNVLQAAEYELDPDAVWARATAAAAAAKKRIDAGEAFADVARAVSEDAATAAAGGALGCVPRRSLGQQYVDAVDALAPGAVSEPFRTRVGCHIVRRDEITDEDVAAILKQQFVQKVDGETYRAAVESAKIELLGEFAADDEDDDAADALPLLE